MNRIKSKIIIICMLFLMFFMCFPLTIHAENTKNHVVKVAYVITPGYQEGTKDKYKSGQGYEYLQKIAGYTGWTYEYVYGGFSELLEKLIAGEVDIMGDLSYTDERADLISYGQYEQGKESFYLYVNGTTSGISSDNYSTINGKKIGVNAGSFQEILWEAWCKENSIQCELVEFTSAQDRENALNNGTIDGTLGSLMLIRTDSTENWRSVLKFGDAPYYFAVNKNKPELLNELNRAQGKILTENPYYNEELSTRYLKTGILTTKQLSEDELRWLKSHDSKIKVGCLDNYLPISDMNDDGQMKGVVPDLLSFIYEEYKDLGIKFEMVLYNDYKKMIADLKDGKIRIASPVYGDYWNAEQEGISLTDSFMSTNMLILHKGEYSPDKIKIIGIDRQSPLQAVYAKIYYSNCKFIMYSSYDDAIEALNSDKVDGVLSSTCSYNVSKQNNESLKNFNIVTLPENVNISMAVSKQNPELMSFINRGISLMGETNVFNSLAVNSNVSIKYTLKDYIYHNPLPSMEIFILILIVLIVINIRLKRAIKRAKTDSMTGLLNKTAMQEKIKKQMVHGGVLFMIDIDNFKKVNDVLGHKTGDQVINYFASNLVKIFRSKDIIGRFGGDEFMVFLPGHSMDNAMIKSKVEQLQKVLEDCDVIKESNGVTCSVSVGVLYIKPKKAISFSEAFEKVDTALYEAKKLGKKTYMVAK